MGKVNVLNADTGDIEIVYGGSECPFTGLDASGPPQYINPGGLNQGTYNILNLNNSLSCIDFIPVSFSGVVVGTFIGIGDLNGVAFVVSYEYATQTTYISYDTTPTEITPTWASPSFIGLTFMSVAPPPVVGSLAYKNVNGITYFSWANCPCIFSWDGSNLGVLTTWLGAAYLNEFNGRLIAANINQIAQAVPNNIYVSVPSTQQDQLALPGGSYSPSSLIWTSEVVGAGAAVTLNLGFNISALVTKNGLGYYGYYNIEIQVSLNSGTTWSIVAQYTTPNNAPTQTVFPQFNFTLNNAILNIPLAGLTNVDTVEVQVLITGLSAVGGGTTTATATITSATISIVNTPILPVFSNYPFQVAWSAALEQYSIWNTLNTAGLVTGAGYENLPDVEDVITGFFMEGPTGFIIRKQGITEITALSNGINPFDFNHLWASHQGIGTQYPLGAAQYGSIGFLPANDDIYTIGYSGINVIGGVAKSAIFNLLTQQEAMVIGGAGFLNIDGESSPVYIIGFGAGPLGFLSTFFLYWQNRNTWYQFQLPQIEADKLQIVQISALNIQPQTPKSQAFNGLTIVAFDTVTGYYYTIGFTTLSGMQGNSANILLASEEIAIYRDITIDGIIVNLLCPNGIQTGQQVNFVVSGVTIGTLDSTSSLGASNYVYAVITGGIFTGKSPQLQILIQSDNVTTPLFQVKFGKISMFGSYDPKQRPI